MLDLTALLPFLCINSKNVCKIGGKGLQLLLAMPLYTHFLGVSPSSTHQDLWPSTQLWA